MRPKSEQIVLLLWMHRCLSNLKIKRQEKIKHEDFQILITMRGYRIFAYKNKEVGGGKVKSGKESTCRLFRLSLFAFGIVSSYCQYMSSILFIFGCICHCLFILSKPSHTS